MTDPRELPHTALQNEIARLRDEGGDPKRLAIANAEMARREGREVAGQDEEPAPKPAPKPAAKAKSGRGKRKR